jgi:uncharacterized protein DUF1592/uncharacterized protein DUF1588/uncharacterized protein DUF1595/uncharacterized protein DUF1587/uncharacterized protein DUF1585
MAVSTFHFAAVLGLCASVLGLAACDLKLGQDSDAPPGSATSSAGAPNLEGKTPEEILASAACKAPEPGRAPLRRMSNAEYRNTVADLLSDSPATQSLVAAATRNFPSETESLGFRNNADYLGVSTLVAQGYIDAAEQFLDSIAENPAFMTCAPIAGSELDCARTFIANFGKRAFRRPLSVEESTQYAALFEKSLKAYDFASAVRATAFAFLQSPKFLYRVEFGAAPTGSTTRPSPYEMANRLSYLFWQSMPDQVLFDAAESNQLATTEQIEAQARRMLQDSKASRLLEYFDQWLGTDALPTTFTRDAALYPGLNPNLVPLFQQETRAFVTSVLARPEGSLNDLFTAPYTFANADLAKHYGLTGPIGGEFVKVDAPGRAGVLTQGMMLARDKATRTSIVRRGLKVRLDLLCQLVPAPPPDVNLTLETANQSQLTQRQRLEEHRVSAACSGCHDLMDPIGLVFEGFDAVGRSRTTDELGAAVDTTSTITRTQDANGSASNPAQLGEMLAQSEQVRACYVTKSFRFFYGRDADAADACSLAQLAQSFKGKAYSLSELLIALTRTDAFLYLPVRTSESP